MWLQLQQTPLWCHSLSALLLSHIPAENYDFYGGTRARRLPWLLVYVLDTESLMQLFALFWFKLTLILERYKRQLVQPAGIQEAQHLCLIKD